MPGTVRHGSGEPTADANDGTIYLATDGHNQIAQNSRWSPILAGPPAGCVVVEDFLQASSGTLPAPWGTQDTSAAGSPTLDYSDDAAGGQYVLKLAADNEVEAITLYFADQLVFDITKGLIFQARIKIDPDVTGAGGDLAAGDIIVCGLASARNATLDNIATHAWFRFEGANHNILVESDDGTTDDDDNDTGVDWVDATFVDLAIDCTNLSAIGFYVDGVRVAQTSAAAATGNVQPFIEVTKAAAANLDHRVTIDYIAVYQRQR